MEREEIKELLIKTFAGELLSESGSYEEGMDKKKISDIFIKLKDKGLNIKEYKESDNKFTHGFMILLNNIPFLLLYDVIEDLLKNQEKIDNFVSIINKLSKYE